MSGMNGMICPACGHHRSNKAHTKACSKKMQAAMRGKPKPKTEKPKQGWRNSPEPKDWVNRGGSFVLNK